MSIALRFDYNLHNIHMHWWCIYCYTQPERHKLRQICCRLVTLPLSSQYHDAFASFACIWRWQFKSAASCQRAWYQHNWDFYPQAWYTKLFQQRRLDKQLASCHVSSRPIRSLHFLIVFSNKFDQENLHSTRNK